MRGSDRAKVLGASQGRLHEKKANPTGFWDGRRERFRDPGIAAFT
jgi:hypothetical protein